MQGTTSSHQQEQAGQEQRAVLRGGTDSEARRFYDGTAGRLGGFARRDGRERLGVSCPDNPQNDGYSPQNDGKPTPSRPDRHDGPPRPRPARRTAWKR